MITFIPTERNWQKDTWVDEPPPSTIDVQVHTDVLFLFSRHHHCTGWSERYVLNSPPLTNRFLSKNFCEIRVSYNKYLFVADTDGPDMGWNRMSYKIKIYLYVYSSSHTLLQVERKFELYNSYTLIHIFVVCI